MEKPEFIMLPEASLWVVFFPFDFWKLHPSEEYSWSYRLPKKQLFFHKNHFPKDWEQQIFLFVLFVFSLLVSPLVSLHFVNEESLGNNNLL